MFLMLMEQDMPIYGMLSIIESNLGVCMRIIFVRILIVIGAGILLSECLVGCGEKSLPPAQQPDKATITITGDTV